ncbi:MAG: hypothetical protein EAZ78_04710 [Oscillatoriales cyanobacterium]|uniref:Lipoprotein n=1 Tax=Microcoleus anatoxicus PTRS2 TaxID=2705321 RepID=A0ABU8YVA1_9CYAN|nr:MAG: hypothetical protein EA000_08685 [Oscillatoriales cyanobacterium]TAE02822.1 MAG: hypothetical protein EAZ98_01015 [Oscillatoriales cyanobacterium]TAE06786.1 MAG: hypothetical protein EAZ96_01410 [Oscillatoriales cyanobacterium]TAF05656.1 MAG: hypothetical protein EAZ78_04710 [Oscillatoriales cyanobacterium]TAF36781.1 MAG: hypothetical protein EAZ68_15950 [Oscillatoriales cyanobacterium]
MKNKLLLLATSACVLTALVPASVVFGVSQSPQRQQEAQQLAQAGTPVAVNEILPKLKGKTQVPIFIPSSISTSQKLYYQSTAKADSYTISIGYTADCHAGVCSFGEIRAQKGGEFSTKMEGVTKTLKNVQLAGGMKGVFHNGCGAYCTASVEWKAQGVLYTVAIKNGAEADVIKMANSAIQAGKR